MAEPTEVEQDLEQDDERPEAVEEDKKSDDKDEEVVPVRKSVLAAQRRIIEKQSKKLAETSKDETSDDEELTPKARKLIEEAVERAVSPLQDELSVRDWFANHPEDKKFEKQARARFEAWQNVPIEEVMKTLRHPAEPEEKAKAEDKVQRASMKGSTGRAKEETIATTREELKKVYQQVKSGNKAAALRSLGIKD